MKLVLATPPAMADSAKRNYLPPMHLAYVGAGVQRLKEVRVTLLDCGGEGLTMGPSVERILAADPDVVGLSVTSCDVGRSRHLLRSLKTAKPGLTTVIGGHHPTAFDELFLAEAPDVDLILRGEADWSFPALVERLIKTEPVAGTPGLSYRASGRIVRGKPQVVEHLDALPFPDRTLFDRRNYFLNVLGIELGRKPWMPSAAVFTSRGCHHQCTFCSKLTSRHHRIRSRSPENILAEILQLSRQGYQLVVVADENFTYDIRRLQRLCRLLLERRLGMHFIFQGTLHHLDRATLDLMHRAGFDGAIVGVESGSDAVLKRYRKAASARAIAAGIANAKQAHLFVHGSFIHGAPGESAEDGDATRRFLKQARPHSATVYELALYPKTEIWKRLFGALPPQTLEDTRNRMISSVPGQIDRTSLDRTIRKFWRAFAISWLHWGRLGEIMALIRYNPMARTVLRKAPWLLVKAFAQLARGRQRSRG